MNFLNSRITSNNVCAFTTIETVPTSSAHWIALRKLQARKRYEIAVSYVCAPKTYVTTSHCLKNYCCARPVSTKKTSFAPVRIALTVFRILLSTNFRWIGTYIPASTANYHRLWSSEHECVGESRAQCA